MFWDSSALVPLLLAEPRSQTVASLLSRDPEPAIWWGSPVECQSALYRQHRLDPLPAPVLEEALRRLQALVEDTDTVSPVEEIRRRAGRLLATHPLRAADAIQLAAALIWCEEAPTDESFVCLDQRLTEAARKEGFRTLPTTRP